MDLKSRLRYDLDLRNFTIYAQWAAVTAACLLYYPTILYLYIYFAFRQGWTPSIWISRTLDYGPMNILFPVPPLAIELPHYFRSKYILYVSMASWFLVPIRYTWFLVLLSRERRLGRSTIFLGIYATLVQSISYPALIYLFKILRRPGPPDLMTRIGGYTMYFIWLIYPGWSAQLPVSFIEKHTWLMAGDILAYYATFSLFGLAALMYAIAKFRRHSYVPSTVLGGTGIEPMVLTTSGLGPSHQFIGEEASEGAIRL